MKEKIVALALKDYTEDKWCQGTISEHDENEQEPTPDNACKRCAVGQLLWAARTFYPDYEVYNILDMFNPHFDGHVVVFNDTHSFAEVRERMEAIIQ